MQATWIEKNILNIVIVSFILTACTDGIDGTGVKEITGTATQGTAIANKNITIKGRDGHKTTGVTNNDGRYSIDVTNLTAPYLLKVERNNSKSALYSVAVSDGVTNIHPFTDLITRNFFKVRGYSVEIEIEYQQAIKTVPTETNINAIENAVKNILKIAMNEFNLNENYDLFNSNFTTNDSSFNKFLKQSNVTILSELINVSLIEPNSEVKSKLINNVRIDKDLTALNMESSKPDAPSSVTAVAASTTSVKVIWHAPLNISIVGYNVYRDNVFLKTTPFTFFEDTGLVTRTQYCYEIEAIDRYETISLKTKIQCATTFDDNIVNPVIPVSAPLNFFVIYAGINGAEFGWAPPAEPNILYYDLYRGSAGNVNLKFAAASVYEYEEFTVLTKTENTCFTVVAVNATGNKSPASNEVCIGKINDTNPPITIANPGGNTFATPLLVRLTCEDGWFDTGCAKTYYTTDGSSPNYILNPKPESVKPYLEPIAISATTTIRYMSLDKAGNLEDETKPDNIQTYTIDPGFTVVPGIEFSSTNYQVSESSRNALISVRRNGDASAAVTVDYDVSGFGAGQVFTQMMGNFYWSENDASSQTISIPIRINAASNLDQDIILTLQNPSANIVLATNSNATLTINNFPCNGLINGPIIVDTVITEPCNVVTSDVQVSQNAKLTISPGVTLIFQSSLNNVTGTPIGLTINNGSFLKANGSVKQPIYFTSDRPVPGQWKGIRFADTNDINNILNYVTVEYGGTVDPNGNGNIIISGNSSVFIENSTITDSASDGISVSTSTGAVLNGVKTTNDFRNISSGTNISYQ